MKKIGKKLKNPYKVTGLSASTKDVDTLKRTVAGIFNSYFYIDSDLDMLLPGAAVESIAERGPGTKGGNRIKHLKDHNWSYNIARLDVLEEREVTFDGKTLSGIYHESYFPETSQGNDMLINIQEGIYDSRSIGFRYQELLLCDPNGSADEMKNWERYYPLALNPEAAQKTGYFWAVQKIKLFEGSDVAFGANSLTPTLDVKGRNFLDGMEAKINSMKAVLAKGNISEEGGYALEMELSQLQALLNEKEPKRDKETDKFTDPKKGLKFLTEIKY